MGLIMLFTFSHDANSCDIYNRENSIKGYEGRTRWGDYQIDLEASRLGWSLRVVKWYLKKKLGIKNDNTIDKVVKAVKRVLITHEHMSIEIGWKNPFEVNAHVIDSYVK